MNTKQSPYAGKYGGGPKFRRYTREELVADSSLGYYRLKSFLANLEAWRLHDIERRLISLLEWGAWRFNSEQKADVTRALADVQQEIATVRYRVKGASESLRRAEQGRLEKRPPSKLLRAKRKKATHERDREAVANFYKKRA